MMMKKTFTFATSIVVIRMNYALASSSSSRSLSLQNNRIFFSSFFKWQPDAVDAVLHKPHMPKHSLLKGIITQFPPNELKKKRAGGVYLVWRRLPRIKQLRLASAIITIRADIKEN